MMKKITIIFILALLFCGQAWGATDTLRITGTINIDDAMINSGQSGKNYGIEVYMKAITTTHRFLIRVKNLSSLLPANATITACICSLYNKYNTDDGYITAYRVLKPWREGTQSDICTDSGVTYDDWNCTDMEWTTEGVECANDDGVDNSYDDGNCNNAARRDRKATGESTVNVTAADTWYAWSIPDSVSQGWYEGTIAENGIFLDPDDDTGNNYFWSTEYTDDTSLCPSFTIIYTTEEAAEGQVIDVQ